MFSNDLVHQLYDSVSIGLILLAYVEYYIVYCGKEYLLQLSILWVRL